MRDYGLVAGIAGVALLVAGVFAPLVQIHFGAVTSFGGGHGDGVFVLALGAIAFTLLFGVKRRLVLIPAVLEAALLSLTFFDMQQRLDAIHHLLWGWVPLLLGAVLLIAAGLSRVVKASE